jgi:three-Cys-motif partner protein
MAETSGRKKIAHRFGGVWTEIKLKALSEYMQFYQNALKHQKFETWYVDAFAGTGDRHEVTEKGGLFENVGLHTVEEILDGSARKALGIVPPFNHYWFSEQHKGRANALIALRTEFSSRDIRVTRGEANAELRTLFGAPPWTNDPNHWRQRAVVFLDPYGMSVEWQTLAMLASTKRVDVWYLFPRKAVVQQLAHDIKGVDDAKRRKLAEIFGCDDWEDQFYRSGPKQGGLFGELEPSKQRIADGNDISAFARERLKTLFTYVSQPLPLLVKNCDFFELYCLSNNGPAVPLIEKGVNHVIEKYAPASRRKSVPQEPDQ